MKTFLMGIGIGLVSVGVGAAPQTEVLSCPDTVKKLLSAFHHERVKNWTPSLNNDLDILKRNNLRSDGLIISKFKPEWDTRVYSTNTAKAGKNGEVPLTDPDSKGVYLFIHGSGTAKASGRNFVDKMDQLGQQGYSALGIDLPFHGDGPVDPRFNDNAYFMKWLAKIVDEVRIPGKPVYLAGHSFGPDVIAEFAYRYPDKIDGGVMVSPAGFDDVTRNWYEKYTEKMDFGADTIENESGGAWAGTVSSQFKWNQPSTAATDPTIKNPKLKLRVLTGDHEEYMPGPVTRVGKHYKVAGKNTYDLCAKFRTFFKNIVCNAEENVGHYIFMHKDKNGDNVIQRELLAIDGHKASEIPELEAAFKERMKMQTAIDQMAQRFAQDAVFKTWAETTYGVDRIKNWVLRNNAKAAEGIIKAFEENWLPARLKQIDENIAATQQTHPQFYAAHKADIENKKLGGHKNRLYSAYYELLSKEAQNK